MQVLRKELSVKRERWVLLYPISPCKGSVTEPQSLCVSCPQTMALQMNVIFVPWHSNPCSMMSLSNRKGLFKRLFFYYVWNGENSQWQMCDCGVGSCVCVCGTLSLTQWLNRDKSAGTTQTAAAFCRKWACEQMKHFLGKSYQDVSKGTCLFYVYRIFSSSLILMSNTS